jgi:hypothetical protein
MAISPAHFQILVADFHTRVLSASGVWYATQVRMGTQREGALKKVSLWLFACAVLTHSSQSLAQQVTGAREIKPAAASQAAGAPAQAIPAAQKPAAAPEVAPPAPAVQGTGARQLEKAAGTEPLPNAPAASPAPAGAEGQQQGETDGPSEAAAPSLGAADDNLAGDVEPTEPPQLDAASSEQAFGVSKLQTQLRELSAERDSYSRLLPWLTVGVGAAATVGGAIAGAGYALGCDTGCSSPAWVGMVVVTGTFVATIGAIWVVHADAGLRELDSRRYYLQQELDRIRASSKGPEAAYPHASPLVSWRFALR